jgi:ribonucleoside-diphosphate reductase alpha chain
MIGIVAESTPSADPLLTAAEQREVKMANVHGPDRYEQHVVVDPIVLRAIKRGVSLDTIEDAYDLALDPERRLAQTAYLQQYVDHAISGTVNLPAVITDAREARDMGDTLMRFLPDLRGITFYPDGARAGQPRKPVPLEWALAQRDVVVETDVGRCDDGVCAL